MINKYGGFVMDAVQILETTNNDYTIQDAADVFFSKLDEGLDDYENGRVVTSEELWAELDEV